MSKTKDALALLDANPDMTPYAAATQVGIKPTTLYVAIKRREESRAAGRQHCPCCGQIVREGFWVKLPEEVPSGGQVYGAKG